MASDPIKRYKFNTRENKKLLTQFQDALHLYNHNAPEVTLEDIQNSLNKSLNINTRSRADNNTPLLSYAVKYSNEEIIKFILSAGADVNIKNFFEETPLMLAVEKNREDMVKTLLKAKADVTALNMHDQDVFHYINPPYNLNIFLMLRLAKMKSNIKASIKKPFQITRDGFLNIIKHNKEKETG